MPLTQRAWFIILTLIIFFPLGLFFLWRSPALSKKFKAIATAIVAVAVLVSNFGGGEKDSYKGHRSAGNVETAVAYNSTLAAGEEPIGDHELKVIAEEHDENDIAADLENNNQIIQKSKDETEPVDDTSAREETASNASIEPKNEPATATASEPQKTAEPNVTPTPQKDSEPVVVTVPQMEPEVTPEPVVEPEPKPEPEPVIEPEPQKDTEPEPVILPVDTTPEPTKVEPAPDRQTPQPVTSGITYVVNTSSKKFHKPSCGNLPTTNRMDVNWSRQECLDKGYSPCKKCNP